MSTSPIKHRRTCCRAVTILAALTVAVSLSSSAEASAGPTAHNARVAEYLVQHRASEHRNARVAEYLLLQRSGTGVSGLRSSH